MFLIGFSDEYLLVTGTVWLVLLLGFVLFAVKRPWQSSRKRVRAAARPFLAVWTLLAVALLLETVFALAYDTTDAFSMCKSSQRWYLRYAHRNHMGFRDRKSFVAPRSAERRRLALLGDSFTFGHGIANPADRFGDLLEARLTRSTPAYELYNLAEPGMSTKGELKLLATLADRGFETDRLLLVYCLNDLEDLSSESARKVGSIIADHPKNVLLRESYLLSFLYYRVRQYNRPEFRNYFFWLQDAYQGAVWETQQAQFDELRAWCATRNVELLVVVFPFLYNLGPDYPFEEAHRALAAYWQRHDTPYIDLLPVMRAHRDEALMVNRFDSHPNERAHALAADAIWQGLLQPRSGDAR